jgi:hypothetical protein
MISKEVVTPVKNGVQILDNSPEWLDYSAGLGPEPGFAGMRGKGVVATDEKEKRIEVNGGLWSIQYNLPIKKVKMAKYFKNSADYKKSKKSKKLFWA